VTSENRTTVETVWPRVTSSNITVPRVKYSELELTVNSMVSLSVSLVYEGAGSAVFEVIARNTDPSFCSLHVSQIFLSFFKTLVGKEVAVELKNNVVITGTLHSVDQYLNIKLIHVSIVQPDLYPQLTALKSCFIRGSVVRYIQIPSDHVDVELLQDAARKENAPAKASNVSSRT
jgi:U6 snRNA-associated Sm-like protein LSm2